MNQKLKRFIESADWIFAKTYAETAPHEYAVREKNKHLEDEFVYFVEFIRKNGYEESFWDRIYTYYDVGDWKYWTMEDPIEQTDLINRALIKVKNMK